MIVISHSAIFPLESVAVYFTRLEPNLNLPNSWLLLITTGSLKKEKKSVLCIEMITGEKSFAGTPVF